MAAQECACQRLVSARRSMTTAIGIGGCFISANYTSAAVALLSYSVRFNPGKPHDRKGYRPGRRGTAQAPAAANRAGRGPGAGQARPRAARLAHLGHRSLQFPLRLLHAQGSVRQRLSLSCARQLLSFEEITRLARIFADHGIEKIRLTGGEPLLRRNIERLIEMLAAITLPDGRSIELTLTTNASLLAKKAAR